MPLAIADNDVKPSVLLVDDNEATCTLVTALLHTEYSTETAKDGAEAIQKLRGRQYAAILLDLLMPDADGFAVLDFLAAERPDVLQRVLVVTASLSDREMVRLRRYPVCGIVHKPFDIEVLLAAVKSCSGAGDGRLRGPLLSGGMILLLADLLR